MIIVHLKVHSFLYCLCNVSKYCSLFALKANKVKLLEKNCIYERIFICVHLNQRDLLEEHIFTGKLHSFVYPINVYNVCIITLLKQSHSSYAL